MPFRKNNLLNIDSLIDKVVLADNEKVADLGCGSFGYFVFPLAQKIGKHGKIYAVDIIKSNLEGIKNSAKIEGLSQIEVIWSDLEIFKATKIPDNHLDGVFLINTLHQSKKYLDIIKESLRMLKSGGRLLIVEWGENGHPFKAGDVNLIKKENLRKELSEISVTIKEDFSAGDYHYGLLLIKK